MWTCLALCAITLRRSLQLSGELAGRFGSLGLWRRPARTPVASEATAGALVVAVSSGLSLRGSLELVADILDAPARAELAAVLRDAHRIEHMRYMRYGILTARRGWLAAADVVNTLPADELLASLSRNR